MKQQVNRLINWYLKSSNGCFWLYGNAGPDYAGPAFFPLEPIEPAKVWKISEARSKESFLIETSGGTAYLADIKYMLGEDFGFFDVESIWQNNIEKNEKEKIIRMIKDAQCDRAEEDIRVIVRECMRQDHILLILNDGKENFLECAKYISEDGAEHIMDVSFPGERTVYFETKTDKKQVYRSYQITNTEPAQIKIERVFGTPILVMNRGKKFIRIDTITGMFEIPPTRIVFLIHPCAFRGRIAT